ncbi:ArsR/SmtB family transcription factor [Evansella clarkii]|uniref:ArsR/SmtB family transcription factor n=1 Tax=Evansella clarkii TaxID=79879 RepID=UPI000998511C|nr:metalloregulator ArsR/SmtB family transcription factor [Evansella clarkii]
MNKTDQRHDVFVAIADPTRRKLIRLLADTEELPLHELTPHFQMGRTAVSKHLSILKEADLVINRKIGRETRYRLNAAPLQEVKDWLTFYEKFWNERALLLKNILEE